MLKDFKKIFYVDVDIESLAMKNNNWNKISKKKN